MKQVKISEVKKGEFFTLSPVENPRESQVFVRSFYDRSERKYFASRFSDIFSGRFFAPSRLVWVGFTF